MNTDDKLEKRHKVFMKYDGNDVISLLIHAGELQADMLAEVKRLREVQRWYDCHHTKCEDIHGAECVPSEVEVERYDKTGHWAYCYECFEDDGLTDSCDNLRHEEG